MTMSDFMAIMCYTITIFSAGFGVGSFINSQKK